MCTYDFRVITQVTFFVLLCPLLSFCCHCCPEKALNGRQSGNEAGYNVQKHVFISSNLSLWMVTTVALQEEGCRFDPKVFLCAFRIVSL